MELVKISIIIVTYYSRELIIDCINSILKYNDLNKNEIEIIVVDNSSNDEYLLLAKLLKENSYENAVILIHNPKNGGYGQGNNVGVNHSKGDILCVMNPDVRLLEPLFKDALLHFKNDNVGSLGYQQITNNLNFSFFQKPEYNLPIYSSIKTKLWNNKQKFNDKEFYLSGAFVFFRKKDFVKAGMYDEKMFMYFEEPDVAKRLNNIRKISIFDPSKKYLHLMEQKEDFNTWLLDVGSNSLKIYFDKHNLNLKKHLNIRFTEYYIHIFAFSLLGNKSKVAKAKAFIKSLKKIK